MKSLVTSLFVCVFCSFAFSQQTDSTIVDSLRTILGNDSLNFEEDQNEDVVYHAAADSIVIENRSFDDEQVQKLRADPDFNYELPPTIAESLWDRFMAWLGQMIDSFFDGAVHTNWGRVITYIVGLALLIVLVMLILKVNAFKIIYSAEGSARKYQVLDENIHEMNFEELIQEAMASQDYRKGIRLLFLYSLKLLSDRHLIHWQSGKTNHDYVSELAEKDLKTGLNELSFYFDYAWYGNFHINRDTFDKARNTFTNWKSKLS